MKLTFRALVIRQSKEGDLVVVNSAAYIVVMLESLRPVYTRLPAVCFSLEIRQGL